MMSKEDKAKSIPILKSVFIPDDGYVFIEGDWKQAELFALAYLSNDINMIKTLTTPGKDIHDDVTINSFKFKVLYPDKTPVIEQDIIDLAKRDIKAFDKLKASLLYVDARGNILDRATFNDSCRVSGKNVSFKFKAPLILYK